MFAKKEKKQHILMQRFWIEEQGDVSFYSQSSNNIDLTVQTDRKHSFTFPFPVSKQKLLFTFLFSS